MEKSRGLSISWCSRDKKQRSSWQQCIVRIGRTSAGRPRPTGALPAVRLRLQRTKTAYKVDKISESFAVREKHSTERSCQSQYRHPRHTGQPTTSDTKWMRIGIIIMSVNRPGTNSTHLCHFVGAEQQPRHPRTTYEPNATQGHTWRPAVDWRI